ncbi:terminase [Crassaminicella thermophila]|uniref:Terminase n=1 Tax=Crassaminicella thermophila TaxID=2599308 RepID=A0A5C0SCN0_CRATE|nr:terminase small subunit [Crassaminicella thermophila]QEK11682.1 terminase [Crassaminicella thermophila]
MARVRSPDSIKAEEMYLKSKGEIELVEIAKELNVSPGTVRSWKNRYKWDDKLNGNINATLQKEKKKKRNVAKKEKKKEIKTDEKILEQLEDAELTEKQRLFCLYYIKNFNATMAAIKAGYSKDTAHVIGHENLRKPKIAAEIRRLKGAIRQEVFIDAMDVLNKYIKIAFADITDYVTFGQKEVPVMGPFGPIEDDEGNPVTKIVNYVDFKESNMVDGTIIAEAKQGKDGISIKLADKMKALDKLSMYFDLFPDKFKRQVEEEKIKIQKEKLNLDGKDKTMKVVIVDDIEGVEDD